jgi:hypothetical protein
MDARPSDIVPIASKESKNHPKEPTNNQHLGRSQTLRYPNESQPPIHDHAMLAILPEAAAGFWSDGRQRMSTRGMLTAGRTVQLIRKLDA